MTAPTKEQALAALDSLHNHACEVSAVAGFGEYEVLRSFIESTSDAELPVGEPGWMPIETAPKGRTVLVGYMNRAGKWRTVRAHYYLPQTLELSDQWNGDDEGDGYAPEGWYEEVENSETINFTECDPTHWMPLPKPPGSGERGE